MKIWIEELKNHVSVPVGTVPFEFFTTLSHPTAAEADGMPRFPCPVGTRWGGMWEYGWFTGDVTLPDTCEGRRVVLFSRVGGEQLVYVNGKALGSVDAKHGYVTLTRCGHAGETYHVQIESYAGHGPRLERLGPCPPERPAIPPVTGPQCTVGKTTLEIWNEDGYQLLMDAETLGQLLSVLPDDSLRAMKVAQALRAFAHTVDFELPPGPRQESFRAARAALREALACHNGSTAPTMWMFGQSHIDLAWLWPFEETCHKSGRTYANQLALMAEYPDYRFLLCEPALMDTLIERNPALWEEVQEAAKRGQIEAEGAFYVECDTNFPSGESLIRQLLWGKQWYKKHFGVDSRVGWQPDTFGFSAVLPQILRKMGVPYFATQKLLRADPECERFPYQNFVWEGMDGSTVEALSFFRNNAPMDAVNLHRRWTQDRSQRENIDTLLFPFGHGDGGGGATRDMVESALRLRDLEGLPRARWGTLRGFFEETSRQAAGNRWVGEMYLPWHRGTYSVQRRQKAAMRRAEEGIRQAEGLAALLPREEREACREKLRQAWHTVLLNQFHDVAGGVGIQRVHREAAEALQGVVGDMNELCRELRTRVYGIAPGDGRVLVNPLPWARREWVRLPEGEIYAEMPPSGAVNAGEAMLPIGDTVRVRESAEGFNLENGLLRLTVDRQGRIMSLMDLENGCPLLRDGQKMNDWRLYRNTQTVYDAWELDREWEKERLEDAVRAEAELTDRTPFRAEITVRYAFGCSTAVQKIILRAASRRIDFETEVDWQERRKMLKTHFESNILCQDAVHEIQFGCVKRPCHRSHSFARDRYEVSNHRYSALCEEGRGFALLNDGLYGLSSNRGELALTLLRAPLAPDDTCDRGVHRFTYSLLPFACSLRDADVARAGYELNMPPALLPGTAEKQTGIYCRSRSVLLETVKPAEDGDGMILRLYESAGTAAEGTLCLPFPARVSFSGMAEDQEEPMASGREIPLRLGAFEILTLRVRRE